MKLLFITQIVDQNDSNMALAHRWIEEFAKHAERVEVVCLKSGRSDLPGNVRVHSLGKEKGVSRVKYVFNFYRYIWQLRHEYDTVFVHMNPEYVLLGGLLWKMWGKKIALWYTHKSVPLKLRIAAHIVDTIFSASKESFRLPTSKLQAMGHGIDTELFALRPTSVGDLRIVTVGRITKTKRLLEMLDALDVLYARKVSFTFDILGVPIFAHDEAYEQGVRKSAAHRPYTHQVHFRGAVPYQSLPEALSHESVFINLSETGSVDRAVLEAMSVGLVPVTSNTAFREILSPYGLYVADADPERLADALVHAQSVDRAELSKYVEEHHSLSHLIPAILSVLEAI
ncbi:MAG: glycosyltransferase family 4 protein [Minisyncoccia bacterium]